MVAKARTRDPLALARELSLAGLLGALGLLLPVGFHALGWGGKIFLPMHLPVLVAGFVVGPGAAASVGLIVPLLSSLLTGMPPMSPPLALLMSAELTVKAAVASVLYRRLRLNFWVALAGALIADWAVLALAAVAAGRFFAIHAPPVRYVAAALALSWPGTALQIIGAPLGVAAIERRVPRLVAARRRGSGEEG